ncbi:hypothetical protein [Acinetobacter sp.]|uniref:hypothetical protein n=1 Tax=Acinetobacter sp. TaxID=472 RepID=UPI0026478DB0|nr:hypothetical protein [Acinetobacter sp.]MDN5511773.1 hypothetical protein [Acinetobacter sp.]MDN5524889.1 hypothetical protein [Acinetobacter sp.]
MKATEFVRRFGLEEAAEIVQGTPSKYMECYHSSVCWDTNTYKYSDRFKPRNSLVNIADLKRLVESHELVVDYYGLTRAKEHAESNYTAPELKAALKQAIADVEACKEVS